jgi:hypothetical protein
VVLGTLDSVLKGGAGNTVRARSGAHAGQDTSFEITNGTLNGTLARIHFGKGFR